MPACTIVAVGRIGRSLEGQLYERFVGRVRPAPALVEIAESPGTPAEAKRREAAALIAAIPQRARAIALDQGGAALDSGQFAALLADAPPAGTCFLIGGPEGLDAAVLARADRSLSLGPMTWPHLLARAMLAEQLFRAYSIATGHPYHRAGRP